MKKHVLFVMMMAILVSCTNVPNNEKEMKVISQSTIDNTINIIKETKPNVNLDLLTRGVVHTAKFWITSDGSEQDFQEFCIRQFIADSKEKENMFEKLQTSLEILFGNYNKMSVDLKLPLHVTGSEITDIDEMFGAWEPSAHFTDDMFSSKISFILTLNFPFYNLEEKNTLGENWSRLEWAYARMGDLITSRVPANISQDIASASTYADNYISNYNIIMGNLRNENAEKLFPEGMNLITHWGLRDELKSNYADKNRGLEKQQMIYGIMKHIVYQTIPEQVIDNDSYIWYPISNKILKDEKEVAVKPEPNTRYLQLHNLAMAYMEEDKYCPTYPTYIQRSFDKSMEVSYDEIEKMFIEFISDPVVAEVGRLIESRLGRELQPFDIWYDGFKSRSNISEDELSEITRKLYPNTATFQNGLENILVKLNFRKDKAHEICSKITVDASRGAGHAWGAQMKSDNARLRSRIAANGMDYKGYNIAIHEFGHNVEQTISLHDVDNYIMNGVPNTGFTEALAFVFQKRDLELLDFNANDPNKEAMLTLDIFWGCYEIMGVSLVDMRTWKWLYENPNATVEDLKNTIIKNATEIWNQYYAPVLGEKDSPILAIYSHMIDVPLYLPNYPYGHIIEYQLENHLTGKNFSQEVIRMFSEGRLTPNIWMKEAVGNNVSTKPLIEATRKHLRD
ncbi:hypothetical protein LJC25_01445 [Bacteroidales bacterium OttesenSCG-928-K03]|nr:hypothetical protein [Bacteroidales bacterium OttesenSCG-928-L14]MDL2240396.1 hypothetical protein [Bacteroidales bacterium OttesenSCG-928-K22]MDL2242371.1 hypothetical protein [Bacteroidales bacterium OttesenSCG-928-K03]